MHMVENPGGRAKMIARIAGGHCFWAESQGGTPFSVLLHFYQQVFQKFVRGGGPMSSP